MIKIVFCRYIITHGSELVINKDWNSNYYVCVTCLLNKVRRTDATQGGPSPSTAPLHKSIRGRKVEIGTGPPQIVFVFEMVHRAVIENTFMFGDVQGAVYSGKVCFEELLDQLFGRSVLNSCYRHVSRHGFESRY